MVTDLIRLAIHSCWQEQGAGKEGGMVDMERLLALLNCATEIEWRDAFFLLCHGQGFDQALFAVVPSRNAALENAFIHSSFAPRWRNIYHAKKLHFVDPTVEHCLARNVPVVWSPVMFRKPPPETSLRGSLGLRHSFRDYLPDSWPKG